MGVCEKKFKYFSTMVNHKRLHFGERPYKCGERECGLRFVNKSYLKSHALSHKQRKLLPANDDVAGNATSSKEPPTSYQPCTSKVLPDCANDVVAGNATSSKEPPTSYQPYTGCELNPLKRKYAKENYCTNHVKNHNVNGLEKHQRQKPCRRLYPCKDCNKIFYSRLMLDCHIHFIKCTNSKDITLANIPGGQDNPDNCTLQKPVKQNHKDLKKETPSKTSHYTSRLRSRHTRNYTSRLRSRHLPHMLTHSDVKPFKCLCCDKSYNQKGDLTRHTKSIHSDMSNHPCKTCKKIFLTMGGLKTHMRFHTDVKSYNCALCDKSYRHKGCLTEHITSIHTQVSHHVCKKCNKSFSTKSCLKDHMKIHTNIKPFKCALCVKAFTQPNELAQHNVRIHTRKFPHPCVTCSKGFMTPSELKVHVAKKH